MFCANCGTKQNEGEKFCPNCGTKFEKPLKVEATRVEEVSKSETSEPENIVPKKNDVTVKIETQTTEEKTVLENEESESIIETGSSNDKEVKVEINKSTITIEPKNNTIVESLNTKEQVSEHNTNVVEKFLPQEEVKTKQIISKKNKEDYLAQEENAKETNTTTETNKLKNKHQIQESDNFYKNNINDNNSTYSTNVTSNTIKREPIINEKDKESILKWAIRYELGLGVPVDTDKAEELYAKVSNGNIVLNSLFPNDKSKRSGIISDAYSVETTVLYDSMKVNAEFYKAKRIEEDRQKLIIRQKEEAERKKIEEIKRLKKEAFKHKSIGFLEFSYIVKCISPDLESLIKGYNTKAEKYGYDKIIVDKDLKLIKGQYKDKSYTGEGFVKGCSSFWRNCVLAVDFEDIIKECEKVQDM